MLIRALSAFCRLFSFLLAAQQAQDPAALAAKALDLMLAGQVSRVSPDVHRRRAEGTAFAGACQVGHDDQDLRRAGENRRRRR